MSVKLNNPVLFHSRKLEQNSVKLNCSESRFFEPPRETKRNIYIWFEKSGSCRNQLTIVKILLGRVIESVEKSRVKEVGGFCSIKLPYWICFTLRKSKSFIIRNVINGQMFFRAKYECSRVV